MTAFSQHGWTRDRTYVSILFVVSRKVSDRGAAFVPVIRGKAVEEVLKSRIVELIFHRREDKEAFRTVSIDIGGGDLHSRDMIEYMKNY